ncbi:MAG: hypothetical protein OEP48_09120 [Betaproteobacteria bacterium]|nr:hypothetical protein [Betaproteobacteria bacterium]MDH3438517.1 hypothetical protein [Betaproteobacteria bacterium]
MKRSIVACCAIAIALAPSVASAQSKKRAKNKIERLACKLGDKDRHARIGVELVNRKVKRFAYYSKLKPRTCSINVERDGPYSLWQDTGRFTYVTTENGRFLIENRQREVHFIFREVDRHFYCGMEPGRINGSLTVIRGKRECKLEGVMRAHDTDDLAPGEAVATPGRH